jgi:alkaline phosphatase D
MISSSTLSRRAFLHGGAFTGLALATGLGASREAAARDSLFTLGVASGDPTHESVILWTRLARDPINGGGMGSRRVRVKWEVATDEHMDHVVQNGSVLAMPDSAHTVHIRVLGLEPDRWYWYRFKADGRLSPVGRTRTFPAPDADSARLRFAFVSCQHFEQGFYPAWENLAKEDIDCVIHLGDYIYEDGARLEDGAGLGVRTHMPISETMNLADYRNRHAQYRTDPSLQAAHARFPFIVTWDDHEVEDNYASDVSVNNGDLNPANDVSATEFRARRAAAYRAFFEHMPLDPLRRPLGPDAPLFRRFSWGRLAEISVLDTRQFRTDQPCAGALDFFPPSGDDLVIPCGQELDPRATMTGALQEAWLLDGLRRSRARWNVIAQQVMMAALDFGPGAAAFDPNFPAGLSLRNVDAWDGYVAARNRLLGFVRDRHVENLVVLTGDTHTSFVADLKADFTDPTSPVVGAEFVGPSITSIFPPPLIPFVQAALLNPDNAHVKFFEGLFHGYVRCTVTPEAWRSDYRVVATTLTPFSPPITLASFVVEDGQPGAVQVLPPNATQ